MRKEKAHTKLYTCWSWCMIGAVLLVGLAAPAQAAERVAQPESTPSHSITSGSIKVSIVGNQVNIETTTPVVVYLKPLGEALAVKLEPEKLKARLAWEGPIIIAPTP